jgi:hypothetical protein
MKSLAVFAGCVALLAGIEIVDTLSPVLYSGAAAIAAIAFGAFLFGFFRPRHSLGAHNMSARERRELNARLAGRLEPLAG